MSFPELHIFKIELYLYPESKEAYINLTGPEEFISQKGVSELPEHIREYVATLAMTLEHLKMVSNHQNYKFELTINDKTVLTTLDELN